MLSILQRLPLLPLNSSGILYPRNKSQESVLTYGNLGIRQPDKLNGKLQFKNLRRYIMLTNHKYLLILIIHILLCHKERIVAGKLIILCREVTGSRICNTAAAVMSLFIAGMLQKFQQCICAVQVDLYSLPTNSIGIKLKNMQWYVLHAYTSGQAMTTAAV